MYVRRGLGDTNTDTGATLASEYLAFAVNPVGAAVATHDSADQASGQVDCTNPWNWTDCISAKLAGWFGGASGKAAAQGFSSPDVMYPTPVAGTLGPTYTDEQLSSILTSSEPSATAAALQDTAISQTDTANKAATQTFFNQVAAGVDAAGSADSSGSGLGTWAIVGLALAGVGVLALMVEAKGQPKRRRR